MNIYLSEIIERMVRIDRGGARLLTLPAPTYSREVLGFDDYICEQLEIHEPYVAEPWADGSNDDEDRQTRMTTSLYLAQRGLYRPRPAAGCHLARATVRM